MISNRRSLPAVVLLACALLSSCGGSTPSDTVSLGGTGAGASPKTVERPWGTVAAFPELKKAQIPLGEDVAFSTDMVMHHEQAIELSDNLLAHDGVDRRVAATASFIKQDQDNEIKIMTAWLDAWTSSLKELDHGTSHQMGSSMPGMLPQADVDSLTTLSTAEAQIEFMRLMTIHHEGAITMSQDYLRTGKNSFTRSTAQHIIREQQLEIDYLANTTKDLCSSGEVSTCPGG